MLYLGSLWSDVVTDNLKRMGIGSWSEKARNMDQWRQIVEEARVHPGL
jgi:hypothetical protein